MQRRHTAGVAASLALLAGAAAADEGRVPLWEPTVIQKPGSYVVTRDIQATNEIVLSIEVDGVTVDLNGFTLSSTSSQLPAVRVTGTAGMQKGVTLRNGRVTGGLHGIHGTAGNVPRRIEVRGVHVDSALDTGILIEDPSDVVLCDGSVRNVQHGIQLGPTGTTALSCVGAVDSAVVRGYLSAAWRDDLLCACTRCWLADVRVVLPPIGPDPDPTGRIRLVDAPGSVIRDIELVMGDPSPQPNIVLERSAGVLLERNVLSGTGAAAPGAAGILADATSKHLRIVGNVLSGMSGDAIQVHAAGAQIYDNQVSGNAGHGIALFGQNALVDANKVFGNTGAGLYFGPNAALHAYRANMLRGNTGGAVGGNPQGGDDAGGNIP